MRRVMVVTTILILGLVIPTVNATESRETDCISGSSSWSLQDQECAVFALGSIVPGDVHLIQFQTDNSVDVLIFSQAGLSVYSNDQSYRTSNVWDEKGTLESLNGTAELSSITLIILKMMTKVLMAGILLLEVSQ